MAEQPDDEHDDKNNPYLKGGENEEDLRHKRWLWFWESRPKKIRDNFENKKKELHIQNELIKGLKTELGDECAKRQPDESIVKKRKREVQKHQARAKRIKKEIQKAKDEVMKDEDTFDWEEYFEKPIGIGDLVIVKTGRYCGEVGEVLKRTKKFRFAIKLVSVENEVVYHKAKNLEKTDDV